MMNLYNENDEKHVDMYKYRLKDMIKYYDVMSSTHEKGNKIVSSNSVVKNRLNKLDFDIMETCKRRAPSHPS